MKKIFYFTSFLLISCTSKSDIKYEFYPNGKGTRSQITYMGKIKEGLAITYFQNGSKKEVFYYSNDSLNGEYISYDIEGNKESQSFFWKNKAVGPNFFYKNDKLELYNESDYSGGIYYVKKYDSSGLLIKEEGLAICPKFYSEVKSDTLTVNSSISLYCFYTRPDGYTNKLNAFVNNSAVELELLPSHMGLINAKLDKKGTYKFKVLAQLTNNKKVISQDSCMKNIIVL